MSVDNIVALIIFACNNRVLEFQSTSVSLTKITHLTQCLYLTVSHVKKDHTRLNSQVVFV